MRSRPFAVALALGALAATPCLALTVQAAPPRPDVAQHLRSQTTPASRMLPAPDDVKDSFLASQRPQLGEAFHSVPSAGTRSFSFGSVSATTTVSPGYDERLRDGVAPLSLIPPRR